MPKWAPEDHLAFLKEKQIEWESFKLLYSNSYKIDIYMEAPEVDSYDEGALVVVNGNQESYTSIDRGGEKSSLVNILTVDKMFEKAISFQNLLRDPYISLHCYSDYEFKEKWPFPHKLVFSCDEYVPDRERQLLRINSFEGLN